MLKGDGGEK